MRFAIPLLILLALIPYAAAGDCISCEEMIDRPAANILTINDDVAHTLEIYTYYENLSASPSRQPINDTIVIIEITNSTGLKELFRTYVDSEGNSRFNFNTWKNGCITFKVLYCPFCSPSSPECGFDACMNFSLISTDKHSAEELDLAPGSLDPPAAISEERYLPALDQLSYCPPPPAMASTPSLCLPLLIIFSLLSGALYLTGRNPWAGFNIGGARVGKHLRYQARGRGFSLDLKAVAMAIKGAAGEMETVKDKDGNVMKDKDGNAIRKGSLSEAKWFGYSMVRDLGDVIVGTKGGSAVAVQDGRDMKTLQLAGGRRARPGIAGAFRQAGRDGRAGYVRVFGAEERNKEGRVTGREHGAGAVLKQWGTEFGQALGRIAATAWDSTWLSFVSNLNAGSALERSITTGERHTRAAFLADVERMTDQYGTQIRDAGVAFAEGRTSVDTEGTVTGTRGARYVDLGTVTGADGRTEGHAIITSPPTIGENGQWSASVSVVTGTGDSRQVTNFSFANGRAVGVEQITASGTGIQFRIGDNNIVSAASITTTGPGGRREEHEVHRDEAGRIDRVGDNIVIQRGSDGQITGVFDRNLPPAQSGQPGGRLEAGNQMFDAINTLNANDGRNLAQMTGVFALNAANMQELTRNTMNTLNASCERERQVYMEQYGLVRVTESDLIGTMDENGRVTRDASTYDARITIVDPTYSPSGAAVERTGLSRDMTIQVTDGQYSGVTGANGAPMRIDTVVVDQESGRTETRIAGTNVVLGSGYGENRGAGAVQEHMAGLSQAAGQVMETYQAYLPRLQEEAGRAFLTAHPEVREAMGEAAERRAQASERFGEAMQARGLSGGALDAATALYSEVTASHSDVQTAGLMEVGRREYETTYSRAMADGRVEPGEMAGISPRAQLHAAAVELGLSPGSREYEAFVAPRSIAIQQREVEAMRLAGSSNPAERATARDQLVELGIVPRGTSPDAAQELAHTNWLNNADAGANLVMRERVNSSIAGAMESRPGLVVPPEVLGDPATGALSQRAAASVLGLGADLIGMSDAQAHARIAERVNADPLIAPGEREAAITMATSYLPSAREVARDYSEAATAVSREVGGQASTYRSIDTDVRYGNIAADLSAPRLPPPPGSPEAYAFSRDAASNPGGHDITTPEGQAAWRRAEETRVGQERDQFISDAARYLQIPPNTKPDDVAAAQERAIGQYLASRAPQYEAQLIPQPPPTAGTPAAQAFEDRTGLQLGTPQGIERWNAEESFRISHPPNVFGMDERTAFLASTAAGPDMRGLESLVPGAAPQAVQWTRTPDPAVPESERPRPVDVNLASVTGFCVGTSATMAAARDYQFDAPRDVYDAGLRGMHHYRAGDEDRAQEEFTRAAVLVNVYEDEHVRSEERYRETVRYGGEERGPSPEFLDRYEEVRREANASTGVDIGAYHRVPPIPPRPEPPAAPPGGTTDVASGGQPRGGGTTPPAS